MLKKDIVRGGKGFIPSHIGPKRICLHRRQAGIVKYSPGDTVLEGLEKDADRPIKVLG